MSLQRKRKLKESTDASFSLRRGSQLAIVSNYCLTWHAGPGAQVEWFSPPNAQAGDYQRKYTPPFRSTIRPPVTSQPLSTGDLDPISDTLKNIISQLGLGIRGTSHVIAERERSGLMEKLKRQGRELWCLALQDAVEDEFSEHASPLFLELGFDDHLLDYPWELMHDGSEFIALKHYVGRFINATTAEDPNRQAPRRSTSRNGWEPLQVLVIGVPQPKNRQNTNTNYECLPGAKQEIRKVHETLTNMPGIQCDILEDATFDAVFDRIERKPYQIIHYIGHAQYDPGTPEKGCLVLHDRDMSKGHIKNFFRQNPPILLFMNACDTTATAGVEAVTGQFHRSSLARTFLETGAYLLGSRWKLSDEAGAVFAPVFYERLLQEGKSIGESVVLARKACKQATDEADLGWASYVYYGDPRVCFSHRPGSIISSVSAPSHDAAPTPKLKSPRPPIPTDQELKALVFSKT